MQKQAFRITGLPAVLWGPPSYHIILAVHGNQSHKQDVPIQILAENAAARGIQVLSFDLPEHGDRKCDPALCNVQNCVNELPAVMEYVKHRWDHISLFACSMGAYFSLLAYNNEPLEQALFLSPVVDMEQLITSMMQWFHVTPAQLQREQAVATPAGQTLYWDYYCYVREHPIRHWPIPTRILYGSQDNLCSRETILRFTKDYPCELKIIQGAEHYFHTPEQLEALDVWLRSSLRQPCV